MKKLTFSFLVLFLLTAVCFVSAEEARFARYPAPSPDGKMIAFSYHGDIWVVPAEGGRALRLTVHEAYEYRPIWSNDGTKIAFTSDRFGNDDVFIMSADGGKATRLTYLNSADVASDWSADDSEIIFTSGRDYSISGANRVPYVYSVSVSGGEPKVYMPEAGNTPRLSHDTTALVFSDHSRRDWYRIGYRGPSNNNIWVWHPADNKYIKVTDFDGVDAEPMWAGDDSGIYYLSEDGGYYNIWKHDLASDEKTQITKHDDHVRFPAISKDGSLIAYALGLDIYTLNVATGESSKLTIQAPDGYRSNTFERKTFTSDIDTFELSPDNKEIVFSVRGEIFVVKEDGGSAVQLTDSPSRDWNMEWNKEGTAVFFSSDRDGEYDLYMVESDDPDETKLSRALAFKVTKLTDTDDREWQPSLSPDGKRLGYLSGWGDLYIMDLETKESKPLLQGWNLNSWSWSPDSRWIAFARQNNEFNADIFIIPAEGGDAVNITKHPDNEFNPTWSKDGKKLAFVSRRLEDNFDIWYVWLRKADHEKTKDDWEFEKDAPKEPANDEKKADAEDNGEEKKEEEKEKDLVEIDFDDIHLRLQRVISMAGEENSVAIAPDNETFVFTSDTEGQTDLYKVKYDGSELNKLTNGGTAPSNIRFSTKGDKIYFKRRGGTIQSVTMSGKTDGHNFRARMKIDLLAEQMQKYEEAWRTLNERFYDGNFHGADWPAVREKYRPYAEVAVADRDFSDVVNMVFGNLNGSHLGFYNASMFSRNGENSGVLGVLFDSEYEGPGLKVKEVFKDSPADKIASKIEPGEIIVSIDGIELNPSVNLASLLNDQADEKVSLMVAKANDMETKRRVILRLANSYEAGNWLYERFVDKARKTTHSLSENRIGYLHIQSMGQPSLERFEMELYAEAYDKDAIVIDVRNNGGGWTTDMVLTILQAAEHAWTQARDADVKGYPQDRRPLYAWSKPVIVLCNEYSYSNAEIFSWAIKTIGRGKVVGQQTFGAVISTGGYGLIDGSFVRTPFRGWYVLGSDINQEHNGCPPDIVVEYQPGDTADGIDRQLEVAVKELLKEIH